MDFKTSPKPVDSPELLASYERQLCTYAHILERRHGKRPERLYVYWTAESRKRDALTEFPFRPRLVEQAGRHFDGVIGKIQAKDFQVVSPPEAAICKECDLRGLCEADGILRPAERTRAGTRKSHDSVPLPSTPARPRADVPSEPVRRTRR